jgi:hypothetical protein
MTENHRPIRSILNEIRLLGRDPLALIADVNLNRRNLMKGQWAIGLRDALPRA